MTKPFSKMHGLGNDFIVLEGISSVPPSLSPVKVASLAHRRLGIGFDQLLLLLPAHDSHSDFTYRIYNADGTEAGQCGNGARCAHAFLLRQGLTQKQQLILQTRTTRLTTEITAANQVRAQLMPSRFFCRTSTAGYTFFHLELGNPHYVCFPEDRTEDADIIRIATQLNHDVAGGVNVGFALLNSRSACNELYLRVYERGAGLTAACGSGALAAAIVAIKEKKAANPLKVNMPGGQLLCGITPDGEPWMEGAVAHVFDGTLPKWMN